MAWRSSSEPTGLERAIAGVSYLTFGIAGLLYIMLGKRRDQSPWFTFHFYQSMILSIVAALVSWGVGPLSELVAVVVGMVSSGAAGALMGGVAIGMSVLKLAFYLLMLFGAIMAFLGKTAEVPVIARVVRQNMR